MRQTLTYVVLFMWGALLLGGAFRPQSPGTEGPPRPQPGFRAPELAGETLDGKVLTLADLKGKAVFLNFWASWCPPCRMEMPEIERLAANLPPDTAILTINVTTQGDSPQAVQAYLEQHGYTFPVALDLTGKAGSDYRVLSLPTSLFISPEGVITARINGPLSYRAMLDYLKAAGR